MYILKNAFKSIVRAKGRNLLIALIVLVLSVSSCIGLSIKRANTTLKNQYAEDREITATLTSTERGKAMTGIPLSTLAEYSESSLVKSFSYSASLYFSAGDGIEPLDVSGSFGQNRDFRDKYGDIDNGEKITSSTSSSTTSTESATEETDTANADSGKLINLRNTYTGVILNLVNEQDDTKEQGESTESSDPALDTQSDESTSSKTVSSEDATEDTVSSNQSSESVTSSSPENQTHQKPQNGENPTQGASSSISSDSSQGATERPSIPQNGENGGNIDNGETTSQPNGTVQGSTDANDDKGTQNGRSENTQSFPQMPQDAEGNGQNGEASQNGGNFRGGDTFITHNQIINNQFFFNMASMNDFTVVGYSSTDAMPDYVSSLEVLDLEDSSRSCVISKALAEENNLSEGDTFKLTNPNNDEESYKFTIVGICDTSESTDTADTSSNASYTDNYIHVSSAAVEKIIATSEKKNTADEDEEDESEENSALSPIYSGTYSFKNLTDFNSMNEVVSADSYSLVSEDVENYEQSIEQLDTLGGYATYFLIVIFIIGAIVLVIINLFSIRDRKYEIGVLTAIGMKKHKVATQFVIELFCITFSALIIGSGIGAVSSVPITNGLLTTINSTDTAEADEDSSAIAVPFENGVEAGTPDTGNDTTPPEMPNGEIARGGSGNMGERFHGFMQDTNNYIASVTSATDLTVIGQMILVGLGLTLISALSAVLFVMRYEPLKILSNRE